MFFYLLHKIHYSSQKRVPTLKEMFETFLKDILTYLPTTHPLLESKASPNLKEMFKTFLKSYLRLFTCAEVPLSRFHRRLRVPLRST